MRIFSTIILVLLLLTSCQTREIHPQQPVSRGSRWPQPRDNNKKEIFLDHGYFQISYDETIRLPNWVSYQLKAENLKKKSAKRRNRFFADPLLQQRQVAFVKPTDYDGDQYDRGHMAPSDDFAWDQAANDATFVMSNMAPQSRALNRGSWKKLEGIIRKWACTEGELRVVTGPIFGTSFVKMSTQVPIPPRFFKVVLDETPPRKAIGFIYMQEDARSQVQEKAVSIAEVEQLTGYRFFLDLKQSEREPIENNYNFKSWVETDCLPSKKKGS
ncbi:DNA/RNA non-specific endonuclease [Bdellovibrio sp. HCB2-146]|uniref:DNA/RNA non-specific endonuclease n=1 Tax=Bdellovibrio sp. HCB2-146 TaxID=3394362 RepID=UPI0039BD8B01